jgi:hypothetical protein
LRSRALTNTWFDLFTGYTLTTYDFLFLPDRPLDSRTDVHTQLFFFGATLRYTHSHWAEASLKARFNSWRASTNTSTDAATVFKRPPYTLNANLLLYPTPSLALTFTLNNLLFHSYDLFYGFPAQPFHLLAGLSFAF